MTGMVLVGPSLGVALGLQAVFFLFVPAYLLLAVWQLHCWPPAWQPA